MLINAIESEEEKSSQRQFVDKILRSTYYMLQSYKEIYLLLLGIIHNTYHEKYILLFNLIVQSLCKCTNHRAYITCRMEKPYRWRTV